MNAQRKTGPVILILLLLVMASIFIVWFFLNQGQSGSQSPEKVFTDSVARLTAIPGSGTIQRFAGVVEPQKTWELTARPEGKIQEVFVKPGDSVQVGDRLLVYDTAESQDTLAEGEIAAERLAGDIEDYTSQLTEQQAKKAKATAEEQLDYTTRINELQNLLKKAQYDLDKQKAANEKTKKEIENAVVLSELSGIVRSVDTSGSSDGDTPLITVAAVGQYRIKGTLNEQNRNALSIGAPVIIRARGNDLTAWKGTLSEMDFDNPAASQSQSQDESSTFTQSANYNFYVTMDDMDGLMVGQHVYIEQDLEQEEHREGLWLDSYYIVQGDGDPYVWAANSHDKIEKRPVTLGQYDEGQKKYEVTDGLTAEDYIAFPNGQIREGADAERNISQQEDTT